MNFPWPLTEIISPSFGVYETLSTGTPPTRIFSCSQRPLLSLRESLYMEETKKFYFMPYALEGTIDFYGRFNAIHPVPFANGTDLGNEYSKAEKTLIEIELMNNVKYYPK